LKLQVGDVVRICSRVTGQRLDGSLVTYSVDGPMATVTAVNRHGHAWVRKGNSYYTTFHYAQEMKFVCRPVLGHIRWQEVGF
jgi:hypothetical protein